MKVVPWGASGGTTDERSRVQAWSAHITIRDRRNRSSNRNPNPSFGVMHANREGVTNASSPWHLRDWSSSSAFSSIGGTSAESFEVSPCAISIGGEVCAASAAPDLSLVLSKDWNAILTLPIGDFPTCVDVARPLQPPHLQQQHDALDTLTLSFVPPPALHPSVHVMLRFYSSRDKLWLVGQLERIVAIAEERQRSARLQVAARRTLAQHQAAGDDVQHASGGVAVQRPLRLPPPAAVASAAGCANVAAKDEVRDAHQPEPSATEVQRGNHNPLHEAFAPFVEQSAVLGRCSLRLSDAVDDGIGAVAPSGPLTDDAGSLPMFSGIDELPEDSDMEELASSDVLRRSARSVSSSSSSVSCHGRPSPPWLVRRQQHKRSETYQQLLHHSASSPWPPKRDVREKEDAAGQYRSAAAQGHSLEDLYKRLVARPSDHKNQQQYVSHRAKGRSSVVGPAAELPYDTTSSSASNASSTTVSASSSPKMMMMSLPPQVIGASARHHHHHHHQSEHGNDDGTNNNMRLEQILDRFASERTRPGTAAAEIPNVPARFGGNKRKASPVEVAAAAACARSPTSVVGGGAPSAGDHNGADAHLRAAVAPPREHRTIHITCRWCQRAKTTLEHERMCSLKPVPCDVCGGIFEQGILRQHLLKSAECRLARTMYRQNAGGPSDPRVARAEAMLRYMDMARREGGSDGEGGQTQHMEWPEPTQRRRASFSAPRSWHQHRGAPPRSSSSEDNTREGLPSSRMGDVQYIDYDGGQMRDWWMAAEAGGGQQQQHTADRGDPRGTVEEVDGTAPSHRSAAQRRSTATPSSAVMGSEPPAFYDAMMVVEEAGGGDSSAPPIQAASTWSPEPSGRRGGTEEGHSDVGNDRSSAAPPTSSPPPPPININNISNELAEIEEVDSPITSASSSPRTASVPVGDPIAVTAVPPDAALGATGAPLRPDGRAPPDTESRRGETRSGVAVESHHRVDASGGTPQSICLDQPIALAAPVKQQQQGGGRGLLSRIGSFLRGNTPPPVPLELPVAFVDNNSRPQQQVSLPPVAAQQVVPRSSLGRSGVRGVAHIAAPQQQQHPPIRFADEPHSHRPRHENMRPMPLQMLRDVGHHYAHSAVGPAEFAPTQHQPPHSAGGTYSSDRRAVSKMRLRDQQAQQRLLLERHAQQQQQQQAARISAPRQQPAGSVAAPMTRVGSSHRRQQPQEYANMLPSSPPFRGDLDSTFDWDDGSHGGGGSSGGGRAGSSASSSRRRRSHQAMPRADATSLPGRRRDSFFRPSLPSSSRAGAPSTGGGAAGCRWCGSTDRAHDNSNCGERKMKCKKCGQLALFRDKDRHRAVCAARHT